MTGNSFLRRYEETGYIQRKPGSGRPSKVTAEVKVTVEAKMQEDDETTAVQLNCLLDGKGFPISLRTILRCRSTLGESPPAVNSTACRMLHICTPYGFIYMYIVSCMWHIMLVMHMFTGWTFRGSAYCQLIRDTNKIKRVQWCVEHLHDSFSV